MTDEIILKGERYFGRFFMKEKTSETEEYIDGEYAARWARIKHSWWEGKGVIEDTKTGRRERFLFFPKDESQKNVILYLKKNKPNKEKRELLLQRLYEQADKSKEILPVVNLELIISLQN